MKQTLRILLLEDDPDDVQLIQDSMRQGGLYFDATVAATKKDFVTAIECKQFDLIISDHQLPQFTSREALFICNERRVYTPFILVTGAVSDDFAVTMLREGASDYILKDRLQRLPSAIKMIIEKKRIQMEKTIAERALKRSNERFELAARASFDVIWDYDPGNRIVYCNEALEKNFGYSKEILSNPAQLLSYVHPSDLQWVKKNIDDFIKGEETRWNKQLRIIRADGSVAYVKSSAVLLRDEKKVIYRVTGVLQDISEVVNLQQVLHQEKIRRQKEITETTIQAQEKERDEIGKELHDNVNQLLATAKIMIDSALRNPAMHDELLRISQESILSAIHEIRSISHSMMPPSLKEDHFIEAIIDIVQRIEMSGTLHIDIHFPEREDFKNINEKIKLTIYRIIQEQTNNILKYAQAGNAFISISLSDNLISLTISDDGIGFDPAKKQKGIGLKNIGSRTEVLDGKMEIISKPGQGCKLVVEIPLMLKESFLFQEEQNAS